MNNRAFLKNAALGIIAAIVGVIVIWAIAQPISPDLRVDSFQEDNQKLTAFAVATTVVFYGTVAVAVGWILFHFRKPRLWWYVIAAAVLIFGIFSSFGAATTNETAI